MPRALSEQHPCHPHFLDCLLGRGGGGGRLILQTGCAFSGKQSGQMDGVSHRTTLAYKCRRLERQDLNGVIQCEMQPRA